MRQEKREPEAASIEVFTDLVRQLEQQSSQARGHSLGKRNAACVLQSKPVFLADALHSPHLRFLMSAQKAQEPLSLNGAKLRRRERLGGNFVNTMREYGVQTQNRAGPGNTHDHLAILHPACRELEISVADEIKAAGVFSLREERGLGWQT